MLKHLKCPFCGKKLNINNIVNDYEAICDDCGYFFNIYEKNAIFCSKTLISKEEFFDSIINELKDIYPLTEEQRIKIVEFYSQFIKKYYKEIAEIQVDSFYEILGLIKEMDIVKKFL